ncbi:MAG: FAD/NAD(P)-binding protein [candidate division Zixibacteria bacterium]|nr:FAD/NAD(P)-binding protein [candidate division Zixibacteria bacterium]
MGTVQKVNAPADNSRTDPMLVRPFTVRRVTKDTYDTFSLELEAKDGRGDFSFGPGQFNMVYVYGVGEVPISISSDPTRTKTLVHTTRAVGTVTIPFTKLSPGAIVGIRGPYGTSWPVEKAEGNDLLIVAGGIGLAPIRPVFYHIMANRAKFNRVVLLYGARTPEDLLFTDELAKWPKQADIEVHQTVDRATGNWKGNVGVVTTLIPRSPCDHTHCMSMVCGPEIMMRFTVMELQKRGIADNRMYISMERNMKCGVGLCGHCQLGTSFVCKDGPVYCFEDVKEVFIKREM